MITSGSRSDFEIAKTIHLAKNTFNQLQNILKCRNINMDTKTKIINSYVMLVLLYGYEWEGIMRISWLERNSNEEILQKANLKGQLMWVNPNNTEKTTTLHWSHHPPLRTGSTDIAGKCKWVIWQWKTKADLPTQP